MEKYEISEIIKLYNMEESFVHICIQNQWITPFDEPQGILDKEDLGRLFLIRDLQYTMGVNDEAIPIIMHLLDQIYWIKKNIKQD